MKTMIKALSLILSVLMIFILPSCQTGENEKSEDASGEVSQSIPAETLFDASAYTYTPSLKDESEMEFGIIIAGDVIVEIAKYVA
jgi:hypothetical protein